MKNLKVIIVDPVHPHLIINLKKKFLLVKYVPGIDYDKLSKIIKNFHVIILRSGLRLDKFLIQKANLLRIIARAGVGMDNIDLVAAKKKKIKYFNVPAQSASSVAELSFGLAHSAYRKIAYCDRILRKNIWKKSEMYGHELSYKNLGVVGYGQIGKKIVKIGKAYNMNIFTTADDLSEKRKKSLLKKKIFLVSLNKILRVSDVLIIAIPLKKTTKNLINIKKLKYMKNDSILINVSRGGIVNETDLYNFLKAKKIFGAGIDVFLTENKNNKLFELDNMTFTSHIGAMTYEAQKRIAIVIEKKLLNLVKKI